MARDRFGFLERHGFVKLSSESLSFVILRTWSIAAIAQSFKGLINLAERGLGHGDVGRVAATAQHGHYGRQPSDKVHHALKVDEKDRVRD